MALYNILQEGGLERHTHISAADKDFAPTFKNLVSLATKDIFKLAHQYGDDVDDLYDDDSCAKMVDQETIEMLIEDEILEHVYGPASTQTNAVWLEKIADKKGKWIFTPSEMRDKVLTVAEIDKNH